MPRHKRQSWKLPAWQAIFSDIKPNTLVNNWDYRTGFDYKYCFSRIEPTKPVKIE